MKGLQGWVNGWVNVNNHHVVFPKGSESSNVPGHNNNNNNNNQNQSQGLHRHSQSENSNSSSSTRRFGQGDGAPNPRLGPYGMKPSSASPGITHGGSGVGGRYQHKFGAGDRGVNAYNSTSPNGQPLRQNAIRGSGSGSGNEVPISNSNSNNSSSNSNSAFYKPGPRSQLASSRMRSQRTSKLLRTNSHSDLLKEKAFSKRESTTSSGSATGSGSGSGAATTGAGGKSAPIRQIGGMGTATSNINRRGTMNSSKVNAPTMIGASTSSIGSQIPVNTGQYINENAFANQHHTKQIAAQYSSANANAYNQASASSVSDNNLHSGRGMGKSRLSPKKTQPVVIGQGSSEMNTTPMMPLTSNGGSGPLSTSQSTKNSNNNSNTNSKDLDRSQRSSHSKNSNSTKSSKSHSQTGTKLKPKPRRPPGDGPHPQLQHPHPFHMHMNMDMGMGPLPMQDQLTESESREVQEMSKRIMTLEADIEYLRCVALNSEYVCTSCEQNKKIHKRSSASSSSNNHHHLNSIHLNNHNPNINVNMNSSSSVASGRTSVKSNKSRLTHSSSNHNMNMSLHSVSSGHGHQHQRRKSGTTTSTSGTSRRNNGSSIGGGSVGGGLDLLSSSIHENLALAESSQRLLDVTLRHKRQIEHMSRETVSFYLMITYPSIQTNHISFYSFIRPLTHSSRSGVHLFRHGGKTICI